MSELHIFMVWRNWFVVYIRSRSKGKKIVDLNFCFIIQIIKFEFGPFDIDRISTNI
jgi:hypothetical protein